MVDAGYAADRLAPPGTASLALDMMDEGTDLADRAPDRGGARDAWAPRSVCGLDLDTVVRDAVGRSRRSSTRRSTIFARRRAATRRSRPTSSNGCGNAASRRSSRRASSPSASRCASCRGCSTGRITPYGTPLTGSGTIDSVRKITRDGLVKFHADWFKPNNATIIVVGATTMAEIKPRLEKLFAAWKSGDGARRRTSAQVPLGKAARLRHRPARIAEQSVILAGHVGRRRPTRTRSPIEAMNAMLGGAVRVAHQHEPPRGQALVVRRADVLLGRARPAAVHRLSRRCRPTRRRSPIQEIQKELAASSADQGDRRRTGDGEERPGADAAGPLGDLAAVGASLQDIVTYGLPDDYFATYGAKVAVSAADIARAAKASVHPDSVVWVVIGDRKKVNRDWRSSDSARSSCSTPTAR